MYNIKFKNNICGHVFSAIKKYLKAFGDTKIYKDFNISKAQFLNIYQQMDTGDTEKYTSFDDMFNGFNTELLTNSKLRITEKKYRETILLLLAYYNNIITF